MAPNLQSTSSPTTSKAPHSFEEAFFSEGSSTSGDDGSSPYPLPSWVDPKLVAEGQRFVSRHFFSVFFAHFISLLFLMCYRPVRDVLFQTQRSETRLKALRRYLSTLLHIKHWYESDLIMEEGAGSKDVLRVRRIHSAIVRSVQRSRQVSKTGRGASLELPKVSNSDEKVIKTLQEELDSKETSELLKLEESTQVISSLDMGVTQFCFMGLISLFPTAFGVFSDPQGLKGFVHLWALIGHLLGIKDEYNICIQQDPKQCIKLQIYQRILLPELKTCPQNTIILWKSLIGGICLYIPFISLKASLLFTLSNVIGLDKMKRFPEMMNSYDRICYALMSRCLTLWMKWWILRIFFNTLLRMAISCASFAYLKSNPISPSPIEPRDSNNNARRVNNIIQIEGMPVTS